MANQAGKLIEASKAAVAAGGDIGKGAGPEVPSSMDSELQDKWHDRTYNPIDDAPKGSISSALNQDAGRYRKGPGPL